MNLAFVCGEKHTNLEGNARRILSGYSFAFSSAACVQLYYALSVKAKKLLVYKIFFKCFCTEIASIHPKIIFNAQKLIVLCDAVCATH